MAETREVGAFALSIGTSLAIEGLLGVHPGNPAQPHGHKMINALWVNLRTLVRNYYQAMKTEEAERIKYPVAAITLLAEVQAVADILRVNGRHMEVVFYHQSDDAIAKQFPRATFRKAKTPKQTAYTTYENLTLMYLLAECNNADVKVTLIKQTPPSSRQIVALLTHYPKDLLWKSAFERVFLLESHTGRLKTYVDWYSKLQGVKADNPLPLNAFTLQVFGDGCLFESQEKKIRDELKQLAKVKRWNGTTTSSKMSADILGIGSSLLKETYKRLMP